MRNSGQGSREQENLQWTMVTNLCLEMEMGNSRKEGEDKPAENESNVETGIKVMNLLSSLQN